MVSKRDRGRLVLAVAGTVAVSAALGALGPAGAAPRIASSPVVTAVDTAVVNAAHPSVSDDGTLVVFEGVPTDDSARTRTVWLRDTTSSAAALDVELTKVLPGVKSGDSVLPSISGDGCSVAVITQMPYDLFRDDDTSDRWDVYRLVLPRCGGKAGDWELVSTRSSSDGDTSALDRVVPERSPSQSADGTVVAFSHRAGSKTQLQAVSVVDLTVPMADPVRSTLVVAPIEEPNTEFRYAGQREADVSADGRFVAFTSDAVIDSSAGGSGLPTWGDGRVAGGFATTQVYLFDRAGPLPDVAPAPATPTPTPTPTTTAPTTTPTTTRPSTATTATTTTTTTFVAPINDPTRPSNLDETTTDSTEPAPVPPSWVASPATSAGDVILVSQVGGKPSTLGASGPVVSADGHYVAYVSSSPELAGSATLPECLGDACPAQVYRFDAVDGRTDLVSRQNTASGAEQIAADQGGSQPTITDDGSQVGFVTRSRNLFPVQALPPTETDDGEIVVSEVDQGLVRRVSTTVDGLTPVAATNAHPELSASGRVIVFDTLDAGAITGKATTGRHVVSVVRTAELSAAALDLGTSGVNLASNEWFVAIRNLGPSSAVPTSAAATPGFIVTGGTCQLGLAVPPGQGCTVAVRAVPALIGRYQGWISVSESIPHAVSVNTLLTAAGGEPRLYPDISGIDFPAATVETTTVVQASSFKNIGLTPARIGAVTIEGANPGDFVVVDDQCVGRVIAVNSTCAIGVQFAPTDVGYRTALLVVTTAEGEYTSSVLSGEASREAVLSVPVDKVRAGDEVPFGGSGFRPGVVLSIGWADGRGETTTVTVSDAGTFLGVLPTSRSERAGLRRLVAQSSDQVATDDVRIQRRSSSSTTD